MERLSPVDASFLAVETATSHMHVATLVVLDPSTAPGGWGFDAVRDVVARRLHLVPPFRRRVVEVPFGLAPPVWVEDPDFALDDHLHQARLPAPGGTSELLDLVADVVSRPLDRARPLWELHAIEGLGSGRTAVVVKVHHAAIDGLLGAALLVHLLDVQPDTGPGTTTSPPWAPDELPLPADLLAGALSWLAGRPGAVVEAARRTLGTAAALRRSNEEAATPAPPAPFAAPRTSLNGPATPGRRVGWAVVALDEVKAVKNAFSCTVNDVVLALCAEALRTHLRRRSEDPGRDLVALVPVAARKPDSPASTMANLLSPMLVSLATTVDGPAARLRAIADGTTRAKAQQRVAGGQLVRDWAELAVPAVVGLAARMASTARLAEYVPPPFNLIVSNVPGPPVPLHLAGARVEAVVPMGPVADGLALNITVLSYASHLHIGLLADAAAVPDVGEIAASFEPALAELAALAGGQNGAGGPPPGREDAGAPLLSSPALRT